MTGWTSSTGCAWASTGRALQPRSLRSRASSGSSTADLRAWPGGTELPALDPDLLVSVALVTTAGLRAWPGAPGEYAAEHAVDSLLGRVLIGALRPRSLPWQAGDVALLLRASVAGFDQTAVMYALGVAKSCSSGIPVSRTPTTP